MLRGYSWVVPLSESGVLERPVLSACCPLLGEQELAFTPPTKGCPLCPASSWLLLLVARASHVTVQSLMVVTGMRDNGTNPCRSTEVETSWAPPPTHPGGLLFSLALVQKLANRCRLGDG